MGVFHLGEAAGGERRWGTPFLLALLVHALGVGVLLAVEPPSPQRTAPPAEAPVVFLLRGPPPAGAPADGRAQVARAARARPSRPAPRVPSMPVLPKTAPSPAQVSPPVVEATPQEAPVLPEAMPRITAAHTLLPPAGLEGADSGGGSALDAAGGGLLGEPEEGTLEVSQVARAPKLLERVAPRYPRRARSDGLEGRVVVRVIIGTDGRVEEEHTRVVRSVPGLDGAALAAIHRWRFSPAIGRSGQPLRVIMEIPVQFSLQ